MHSSPGAGVSVFFLLCAASTTAHCAGPEVLLAGGSEDAGLPDAGPADPAAGEAGLNASQDAGGLPIVTTVAGNDGFYDGTGGPNGTAEFSFPAGLTVTPAGIVIVADAMNNRVRAIDTLGNVSTLAGNGVAGYADGTGGATGTAEFNQPSSVAIDTEGFIYVTDTVNDRIRRLRPSGNVTTVAGNGIPGYADGTGGPDGTAEFQVPAAIAIGPDGTIYVADMGNNRIREIDGAGNVTTLAGNGREGSSDGTGGPNGTAEFANPSGVAVDMEGTVYVADGMNQRICKIDSNGNVTTLAGNGMQGSVDGTGGPDGTAEFHFPSGLTVDGQGNIYDADQGGENIRKVDPAGNVTTVAGNGIAGYADGTGGPDGVAEFNDPIGVAVGSLGQLYVSDGLNNRVRMIDASNTVTTLAGNGDSQFTGGWSDGTGGPDGSAQFFQPEGVALDAAGDLYVGDAWNNRIRRIDASGNVTTVAGNGEYGFADGTGGPAGAAEFASPSGVAADASGNVYVSDTYNERIRKIDIAGNVTTIAGTGGAGFADGPGGSSGVAQFNLPLGIAVDSSGNIYVADCNNNRIRRIDTSLNVTTVAGGGGRDESVFWADGTGGLNGTARFYAPTSVAVDELGDVYVADEYNNRVRKIDRAGNVTTVAGNGALGWVDGTGGPNGSAEFRRPTGITVDAAGNIYVGDTVNSRIRKIDPSGNVTTVAGNGDWGWVDGIGGPSGPAEFFMPWGVVADTSGFLYVADSANSRIRGIQQ